MFKENDMVKILEWIKIADQSKSLDVETSNDWEAWVARPCIDTILAPRQARAILEVVGYFANKGVKISTIIEGIVKFVIEKHNKQIGCKIETKSGDARNTN